MSGNKVKYQVLHASSNESGHTAHELVLRNSADGESSSKGKKSKGRGWESARFCSFPQELLVALDTVTDISQIQILSHQSKIASKVEIWVALAAYGLDNNACKSISWKRLGYLSLDKNERSNWKARELKSVYINSTANYIKFSLHEAHANSINLFNQIGVVALTILGNPKIADTSVSTVNNNMDAITKQKVHDLMQRKKIAVEREDYDEAKRCKMAIDRLKSASQQLLELEREKKIAVQKEDYDAAKAFKLQIERLRNMSLDTIQPDPVHANYAPMIQRMPSNHQQPLPAPAYPKLPPPQRSLSMTRHDDAPVIPVASTKAMPPPRQASGRNISNPDERQIRPMRRNYGTIDASSAVDPFGHNMENNDTTNGTTMNKNKPQVVQESPYVSAHTSMNSSDHVTGQTGNNRSDHNSNGKAPPPLKAAVKKGSEKAIEMFGEYTVRLLHSNNWNHRDQGLKAVSEFVKKQEHPDARQVLRLCCKVIYNALQDRVAAVILSGIETMNAVVTTYASATQAQLDDNERCKCLHSSIVTLVNLLGHSNARVVDAVGSMLIALCHENDALCRQIYNVLIKKMKRLLPKHLKGRGLILLQLIAQFQVPKGVELQAMMSHIVLPQLRDKNGDVRDVGIQITGLLYQIKPIRHQVVQQLEHDNLNDFIKETLNNHFESLCGTTNVLEREPKSIKEQSRPSKTMNRTGTRTMSSSTMSRTQTRTRFGTGTGTGAGPNKHNNKMAKQGGKVQRSPVHQNKPNNNTNNRNNGMNANATTTAEMPVQHPTEEVQEEEEDTCNFCGLQDAAFAQNEENLDLHYWQSCPMLTSCKLCEQVIEIATLHEHIMTECESGIKHVVCKKCSVPYPVGQAHTCKIKRPPKPNELICPLCLDVISGSQKQPDPWKNHLLSYPGCPCNPRQLLN